MQIFNTRPYYYFDQYSANCNHVQFISGDSAYQSADVSLAVPLDLGDLLLVLLVLHPQVAGLHLVGLDHVAEGLIGLLLRVLQLRYLLQELHSLLVKEAARVLLGLQCQRCAHLKKRDGERGRVRG